MLGWFPTPYPDELLYSICARYQEQTDYPSVGAVTEDIFGSSYISPVVDLPCYLERLVSALPPGHRISADRLIDNNTLFPFYSPFLPEDRVKRIRKEMRYGDSRIVHKLAGINNSSIRTPDWLRFCPTCVRVDRRRFDFTYWHRIHQLPSIEVCPDHAVFLENSRARARNRFSKYGYISAERAVEGSLARPIDLSKTAHAVQLSIARDAQWLLFQTHVPSDLAGLRARYLTLLSERGLAFMTGIVWVKKLLPILKAYFSSSILSTFQCDFDEKSIWSWPAELIKDTHKGKANHPLRHLLLMQFLGHTVESFFKLPKSLQLFGKGPWPCLNVTCSHYRGCNINEIQVVYKSTGRRGTLPVATFRCNDCGFTYNRIGPDREPEDRHRINRVLEYGPVWEAALKQYWNNSKLGLREVAKRLGTTDRRIIRREAERIGLPFPRRGPGYQVTEKNKNQRLHYQNKKPSKDDRNRYRREWLHVRKNNLKLSRSALQRRFSHLDYWLKRYDSQWFWNHMPRPRKTGGKTSRVDWRSRDTKLAGEVKVATKLLKEASGRPVRITKSLIAREIDTHSLNKQLDKLPRTRKALEEVVETRFEFANRRLRWAADSFRKENLSPCRSALLLRASIGSDIWEVPSVKATTDAALRSLQL